MGIEDLFKPRGLTDRPAIKTEKVSLSGSDWLGAAAPLLLRPIGAPLPTDQAMFAGAGGGGGGFGGGGRGAPGPAGPQGFQGPAGGGGAGSGWTDDGAVVRLTTITDQVVIGALVPIGTEALRVVGDERLEGQLLSSEGTAALPAWSFFSDTNTGIFRGISPDTLSVSTGGSERFRWTTTQALSVAAGSAASPAYSFTLDPDTGIFRSTPDTLDITTGGVSRINVNGTDVASTLPFRGTTGTAAVPAYSFTADSDTGIFRGLSLDTLSVSAGGSERFRWSTTQALSGTFGTAALPAYSFTADSDTGIFSGPALDTLSVSTGGVERFRWSTTQAASGTLGSAASPAYSFLLDLDTGIFASVTNTVEIATGGVSRWNVNTVDVTSTLPLRGPAGTAATPAYSFAADTNTGIFSAGADDVSVSTSGVSRISVDIVDIAFTLPMRGPDGSVAAPTYSFTSSTSTGLSFVSRTPQLVISVAGTTVMDFFAGFMRPFVPVHNIDGSVGSPSYTFGADGNTGFFRPGADEIAASSGGVERFRVTTVGSTVTGTLLVTSEIGLDERVGDPVAVANRGFVYTKDVAGVTELFFERDNGTVVQLS